MNAHIQRKTILHTPHKNFSILDKSSLEAYLSSADLIDSSTTLWLSSNVFFMSSIHFSIFSWLWVTKSNLDLYFSVTLSESIIFICNSLFFLCSLSNFSFCFHSNSFLKSSNFSALSTLQASMSHFLAHSFHVIIIFN
jgi:hypothetical protein